MSSTVLLIEIPAVKIKQKNNKLIRVDDVYFNNFLILHNTGFYLDIRLRGLLFSLLSIFS